MILRARLFPLSEESRDIISKLLPSISLHATSGRYPADVGDPILPEIIRRGDSAHGYKIGAEVVLSKIELQTVTHFEAVCRKVISESKRNYEHNVSVSKASNLIQAGSDEPIRLVSGFALDRVTLKPNMIGCIGDWTNEYAIGSVIYEVLQQANLTGWSPKPLLDPATQSPYQEVFQLFSDSILKPAIIDCSVERIDSSLQEENGRLRHLGCLTYQADALTGTSDFSRTAEPWGGWFGWPSWVVSSRAATVFETYKFRGWVFRPVFTVESELYRYYLDRWHVLNDLVSMCTKSKFDGGRW